MSELDHEINRRRAFAIIAHPDAGKTTLTEKLLLYGGAIHLAGHVRARKDRKSTKSDFMALEQERGISVSTAALQFEYDGMVMNLLDTPGHQDFSEDTYRTLMAVDSAIMLLDASRGVEPQTIKLFKICRERNLPIITFINKMDMPALEAFELLDNVEKVLGISAVPLVWPMGSGRDFKGYFDLYGKKLHRFERTVGGAHRAPEAMSGIEDASVRELMGEAEHDKFCEDVAIAGEALPAFDKEKFLRGEMTPVLFGSAVTNFGVEHLLANLKDLAPAPRPVRLDNGSELSPLENRFTGFVFKMQANMNKWMAWIDKLAQAGKYVGGEALLPGGKNIKGSHKNVTDGPYTEGKEIVGGYFIVNADNYDEAIALCNDYPDYENGGYIQVRQVMKFDM